MDVIKALPVQLFSRLIWFTSYFPGKTRILQILIKKIPYRPGELRHHTGFRWNIDSEHAQSMFLFSCEPFCSKVLLNASLNVELFFDIGANRGWYSCLLKTANPKLEIHAFEPDEKIHFFLAKNLKQYLSSHKDIHVNKVALGRRNGTATLSTYVDGNDGMMTLYPQETMSVKSIQAVRIQTLDDYYKVKAIKMNEKFTLIKIDVEGSELETIEGAREFISINRPTIVMEINSLLLSSSSTSSTAVLDLMKSLGYAAFWIDERGKIEVCRDHSYPPHESVLGNSAGANYLFLHKDEMKKPLLNELVRQYQLEAP